MYKFGEIILVEFPFSDNSSSKKRPALILLDSLDNDVILARITSQLHITEYDLEVEN